MNDAAYHRIPDDMKQYPQFVAWRYEGRRGDKLAKVPHSPRTGQPSSVSDSSTWATFDEAVKAAPKYDGIGFVFSNDDPFSGIDLDDTSNDILAIERQKKLFEEVDSYSEISPSGKGLHIIAKGRVPSGRRQGTIEVYSSNRYFTMTGNVFNPKPIVERQDLLMKLWTELGQGRTAASAVILNAKASIETDQTIIERALNATNGNKFRALSNGDGSVLNSKDQSGSAIDQALVNIIQFYTQDPAQIERIWLSSPQGQRVKTRTRKDYRDATIARAFDKELPHIIIHGLKQPEFPVQIVSNLTVVREFSAPCPSRKSYSRVGVMQSG